MTPTPAFTDRHIGPRDADLETMLGRIGYESLDALTRAALPPAITSSVDLAIESAESEHSVIEELRAFARDNTVTTSMIGMGYYGTILPPVIQRNVLENPGWYTAYTPYQPEISQGRLEALLNFQTVISDLTGLPTAGASLLDEGTAAAEAMTLMRRGSKASGDAVMLIDAEAFPQTIAVVRTRARALGLDVVVTDLTEVRDQAGLRAAAGDRDVFGVLVQYPSADGQIHAWAELTAAAHAVGALVTAAADLLALTLLQAPGEWGADVAVGTTQRFGVPMGFGGPHAGYMSVRAGLERTMPGRLVGVSIDSAGAPAYRLALQTREQHIRRERATSNICTAQVLLAVIASMYAVYHGPDGLTRIARGVHGKTRALADALRAGGVAVREGTFFDTLTVDVPGTADEVVAAALESGITLWRQDADQVRLSVDELTAGEHLAAVAAAFGVDGAGLRDGVAPASIEGELARTSEFLTHPTFHAYRSETAMLRYLRRLSDRDFALDRGMIPLGSCTMKLNATTEMLPITWPEFSALHPFAPAEQCGGIRRLISELEDYLCEITGYDAVSLQPNAGAQGELAGLLAIRAYHHANGDGERDVCLIPASAHGTNAASAAMAGLRVVVIKTAPGGDIDMVDLKDKIEQHHDRLAAIMVTYPSTHGVFEDTITELCEMVHNAGGQVYVDGANLNALVGLAKVGTFGADVSHLNLHKTFCIPHGGGGPGVGPVGVRAHLAPFLPNHPVTGDGPETGVGPISAAPFGSASILPISWSYIRLMGGAGLRKATQVAILSANYIATRLREHYPVLYTGANGLVAHECILDVRPLTKSSGITVDDIAKRLIDYGFHAPTMSFPVAGTLMVEPTESEDLTELDRFCDAMIAIREEAAAVERGEVDAADSVLRHAPHTAASLVGEWDHPYDRATAAFPPGVDPTSKYWAPVGRIDGAYGDRHLVCSCPPPEAYED